MSAWGGRWRRIPVLALCVGVFAFALGLDAWVSDAGAGRAKQGGLTSQERKALKVVAVRASGADGAGLLVTATFQGNIEKAIGRGHLKQALVAVLLQPADTSRPALGVATRRGGSIGETLTNAGTAGVGVVRNGRELSFLIEDAGIGLADYPGIEVKSFARFPGPSPRHRASASETAEFWEELDRQVSADEQAIPRSERYPTCRSLQFMAEDLDPLLKRAKDREARLDKARRAFEKAIPELEDTLTLGQFARAGNIVLALASGALAPLSVLFSATPAAPFAAGTLLLYGHTLNNSVNLREKNQALKDAIRGLKLDVRLADAYIERNRALIEKIREVQGKIAALAGVACIPPTVTPIHAVFNEATRSTLYTENVTGQDLKYRWTVSIPADPPCANGFQPGVPQPNQATWNHADTEEGGPCSHKAYDATGRGHPGTVWVTVYNRSWRCVATFVGTQGDYGIPTGDGPTPGSCELE
jgi:hypothetical protein